MEDNRNDSKIVEYMLFTCQLRNRPLHLAGVVYEGDGDEEESCYAAVTLIPGYSDTWTYFDANLPEVFLRGHVEVISHEAVQFTAPKVGDVGESVTRKIEFKSAVWGQHQRYQDWLDKRDMSDDDDDEDWLREAKMRDLESRLTRGS